MSIEVLPPASLGDGGETKQRLNDEVIMREGICLLGVDFIFIFYDASDCASLFFLYDFLIFFLQTIFPL